MKGELKVGLGERSYPVYFGESVPQRLEETVAEISRGGRSIGVLTDDGVYAKQRKFLSAAFPDQPLLVLPAGEKTKSLAFLGKVYDFLAENRVDRSGSLIAFGGGVIGDLGGFAGASYLRGIDYYQVPTTLLAMVDSSVGGKTGINLPAGKNMAGAFYQPRAVFIHPPLLNTLPRSEFSAGMAEIIKTALLAEAGLFARLQMLDRLYPEHAELPGIIRACCAIKAEIVMGDERETAGQGGRALLNLGHTFAHAIEVVSGYGAYLHGEAVAIGLVLAARLSRRLGYIEESDVEAVSKLISENGLPLQLRKPLSLKALLEAMRRDKKVLGRKRRFVVLEALGVAATREGIAEEWIRELFLAAGAEKD